MSIIERLFAVIAPHTCESCGLEGSLLCPTCAATRVTLPAAFCYRCTQTIPAGNVCPPCTAAGGLGFVWATTEYTSLAKRLVRRLKFSFAQAVADDMARLVAAKVLSEVSAPAPDASPERLVFVPVPAVPSRVRQRGFDQAVLLAKSSARGSGFSYGALLVRVGRHRQVGADRHARITQLGGEFRAKAARLDPLPTYVLVDDVLTTGATMEAAAAALRAAGAKTIGAAVFAISPPRPKSSSTLQVAGIIDKPAGRT